MAARHPILKLLGPCWLALGLDISAPPAWSQTPLTEYEGKAKLLRVLPDYLNRPKGAAGADILILGLCPFESALELELARSPLKSQYVRRLPASISPTLVFICGSEEDQLPQILKQFKGKPILTVSDTPGFTERGVMVGLLMKEDRLTLEVNVRSLRDAGLELSPHILQRARIVGER